MARNESAEGFLRLEILIEEPLPNVTYAVQRGQTELLGAQRAHNGALSFQFELRLGAPQSDGSARYLGEYAQGSVRDRFVYVCSGKRAGDALSCWDRRAKVKLASIPQTWIARALASKHGKLRAKIDGTANDGGPCCATVPLVTPGWEFVEEASA